MYKSSIDEADIPADQLSKNMCNVHCDADSKYRMSSDTFVSCAVDEIASGRSIAWQADGVDVERNWVVQHRFFEFFCLVENRTSKSKLVFSVYFSSIVRV